MPKGLQKSIKIYISKLKRPTPKSQNGPSPTTTGRLLSACKYPKTPSFAIDRDQSNGHDNAATLTDIDRFLFENFNSLYTDGCNNDINGITKKNAYTSHSPNLQCGDVECDKSVIASDSPRFLKTPPNLQPSHRFFVSPCTSNSLMEEAESSRSASEDMAPHALPGDSIAVLTYTHDPYEDFRRSMKEMVEARQVGRCQQQQQAMDWDFMEDLLFCYLNLNEKRSHKYILGAFVDLMGSFRQQASGKAPISVRKVPASREKRRRKVVGRNAADVIFRERVDVELS